MERLYYFIEEAAGKVDCAASDIYYFLETDRTTASLYCTAQQLSKQYLLNNQPNSIQSSCYIPWCDNKPKALRTDMVIERAFKKPKKGSPALRKAIELDYKASIRDLDCEEIIEVMDDTANER